MKVAVITVAGISSRFNEGIEEAGRCLKAIYTEGNLSDTLLFHLVKKCSYADRIIVVGGYKFENLEQYITGQIPEKEKEKITGYAWEPWHIRYVTRALSLYLSLTKMSLEEYWNI